MKRISLLIFTASMIIGCAGTVESDLPTVDSVDLEQYLGTWYSIAHIPTTFEEKCEGNTTANYTLKPNGDIRVSNTCLVSTRNGMEYDADIGKAWIPNPDEPAKLKVSFVLGLFAGDYWIMEIGDDYEYAFVGHPGYNYLWILSRDPEISDEQYDQWLSDIAGYGYDTNRVERVPQGLEIENE